MVRKDPLKERGPAPPGGRASIREGGRADLPANIFVLQPEIEYQKLWRHVLIGTGTCIKMIENYATIGMPGDPMESLIGLRDRLTKIINNYEAQNAQ